MRKPFELIIDMRNSQLVVTLWDSSKSNVQTLKGWLNIIQQTIFEWETRMIYSAKIQGVTFQQLF